MKIKTSELTGIALDWAVAECEGAMLSCTPWGSHAKGGGIRLRHGGYFNPSNNWGLAGPIIEREGINLLQWGYSWDASASRGPKVGQRFEGQTPLIAAMRCYVASKLGNEVDVPDELAGA